MSSQKILTIILVTLVTGAGAYIGTVKIKEGITISPSPSPQNVEFSFNKKSPESSHAQQNQAPQTPQELPFSKNKNVGNFPGIVKDDIRQNKKAIIETAKGKIEFEIYPEATAAASNFMILAANGFYDGLIFHRVEDWVIQGGDPTGTGSGGPGYRFLDEPVTRSYTKGIVAMANSGPDTNGSQFFILTKDTPLEPKYTIFGNVISGMNIVEQIKVGDVMQRVQIENLTPPRFGP